MKKVYKSKQSETTIMELYDRQLKALNFEYEDLYVDTRFGKAHVVKFGKLDGKPLLIIHGGNNTTPYSLRYYADIPLKIICMTQFSSTYAMHFLTLGECVGSLNLCYQSSLAILSRAVKWDGQILRVKSISREMKALNYLAILFGQVQTFRLIVA